MASNKELTFRSNREGKNCPASGMACRECSNFLQAKIASLKSLVLVVAVLFCAKFSSVNAATGGFGDYGAPLDILKNY
ncbi:MAG TPA: hypothetical protein VGE41_07180, partial [Verrucomicrobiae bacterium]